MESSNLTGQLNLDTVKSLYQEQKFAECLPLLQNLLGKEPHNTAYLIYLGQCYFHLGKYIEAESQFLRIISIGISNNKSLSRVYKLLGDTLIKQNRMKNAIQNYKEALKLEPSSTSVRKILENFDYDVSELFEGNQNNKSQTATESSPEVHHHYYGAQSAQASSVEQTSTPSQVELPPDEQAGEVIVAGSRRITTFRRSLFLAIVTIPFVPYILTQPGIFIHMGAIALPILLVFFGSLGYAVFASFACKYTIRENRIDIVDGLFDQEMKLDSPGFLKL